MALMNKMSPMAASTQQHEHRCNDCGRLYVCRHATTEHFGCASSERAQCARCKREEN